MREPSGNSPEISDLDLWDRYLSGEATFSDAAALRERVREDGGNPERLERIRMLLGASQGAPTAANWSRLEAVHARIAQHAGVHTGVQRVGFSSLGRVASRGFVQALRTPYTRTFAATLGVAAAAALFVGVTRRSAQRTFGEETAVAQSYTTRVAQQSIITLTDGSRVTLAPQSKLDVFDGFGTNTRTVRVSGEAWFDVRTVAGAPFVVKAGTVETRVLGTTFSVRQYASTDAVDIMVQTGKVAARNIRGATIAITARSAARITDSTAQPLSSREQHVYTDWATGKLVFEDAQVALMLSTLSRWYGVQFTLADTALAAKKVSVTFTIAESADMLAQIRALLNVNVSVDGKMVTLVPRRAAPAPWRNHLLKTIREVGR